VSSLCVFGDSKTNSSCRTIRLSTNAVIAPRTQLSRRLEEMERMGSLYPPGGLIFTVKTGTTINPFNL